MARNGTKGGIFRCSSCDAEHLRWLGRCPQCRTFGSVSETPELTKSGSSVHSGLRTKTRGGAVTRAAESVVSVTAKPQARISSRSHEFDRVLGGGLVRGQVVLLAGEPGVGKSTLLLAVADSYAATTPDPVLYISGEESAEQIGLRAHRTGVSAENLLVANETDLNALLAHVDEHDPAMLVVDSVQTLASDAIEARAGGVAQVHEVAAVLTRVAKSRGIPTLLIGQSTRENSIAGPRALEHIVDTVLTFEGDPHMPIRMLRSVKNRFGPADEVVCYEQTESGLAELPDPSSVFRSSRQSQATGTCATVTLEGRRPIVAEVQALVAPVSAAHPRRAVSGLDASRTAMVTAVADHSGSFKLHQSDVYVATVGGLRITDPAVDLAAALAIASSAMKKPVPADVVALGEVALSGELRAAPSLRARLVEASRLGFTTALAAPGAGDIQGLKVIEIGNLHEALSWLSR
ncbi:MAG: DNA repair protein RadA [Actinobacteria bacterium]|nr:DNA repair protein RadA [Actinomycetota bacterium]